MVLAAFPYVFMFFVDEHTQLGQALGLSGVRTGLSTAISVVTTMAIGLGVINLFYVHGGNLLRRRQGWGLSIIVFVTFFAVVGLMLWQYRIDARARALYRDTEVARKAYEAALEQPAETRDAAVAALGEDQLALAAQYYEFEATYQFQPLRFYLNYFLNSLAPTVMALLGFYITFAAYRAFRLRSLEASVMMLAAAIVIIGTDPIGGLISHGLNVLIPGDARVVWLPLWGDLANRVWNSGMERGLAIGIGIAIIAVSLRILLGFERGLTQVRGGED